MKTATILFLRPLVTLAVAAGMLAAGVPAVTAAAKVTSAEKGGAVAPSTAKKAGKAVGAAGTNESNEAIMAELVKGDTSALPPIPQSVFGVPKSAQEGRDPFFPASTRLFGEVTPSNTNAAPSRVDLVLKGLVGSPGNRFATLNSTVFAEGEEREMNVGGGRVRVRCLEIREDAAVIEMGGVRQTLRMRQGP